MWKITLAAMAVFLMGQTSPRSPAGLEPVPTRDFDVREALAPAGKAAPQPAGETVGAFRFICRDGHRNNDDPLVYPGQPGKSHLHSFTGNTLTDAYSTHETLRMRGGSTCNDFGDGTKAANRSAYWFPALLDGKGNAIQSDYDNFYYKAWPRASTLCTDGLHQKACVGLPNGINFVIGRDMARLDLPPIGNFHFGCTGVGSNFKTMDEALKNCSIDKQFFLVIDAPACWNGQLDSADHRSHMSYSIDTHKGYSACPASHPYRIPALTFSRFYSVAAGDDVSLWRFSSDHMAPGQPRGSTIHADYKEAWDVSVKVIWMDNCIERKLSCNGGNLGNGTALRGASQPLYKVNGVVRSLWVNPVHLVPAPSGIM